MLKDIYDPLTEYVNVFRDRFRNVAESTFAELAEEARVDTAANRETCRQLYKMQNMLSSTKTRITWWRFFCTLIWISVVGGIVAACFIYTGQLITPIPQPDIFCIIGICEAMTLALLICAVHPNIRKLKAERDTLAASAESLEKEAWDQMAPLNRLYDWDVLTRMMSKTVPKLEFDPYFTTQRLSDLKMSYNWDDSFNAERSVIYSHSGLINGNPFVICRTRKMIMGTKTYYGSKTIYWTTSVRGADGKMQTVQRSQTLTASVTAPYPEYFEKTWLIYGNTAAPDLTFHREQSDLAGRENTMEFRRKRRKMRKKARDLENADFAMMTNEDFEVAFDTSNRNDNQQFALLFTPLAQESMLKLLKDTEHGYGDDFDFDKNRMINTIVSDHMQEVNLDMNPERYHNFDFNRAQEDFYRINFGHFKAIYFSLAPLLCIPMYQQIRPQHEIYGHDMQRQSAFWEHEALANFWGQNNFRHPSCVTDCILKTQQTIDSNGKSTITVHAHGYRREQQLSYISRWGGDGRMHQVPVYWDEYFPVTGSGRIYMKEDNELPEGSITHRQRLDHINKVLTQSDLNIYRRHIASSKA